MSSSDANQGDTNSESAHSRRVEKYVYEERVSQTGSSATSVNAPVRKRRSVLRYILFALGAVVVGLLLAISMQPNELKVTRTATIAAPAPAVFAHVNDFHKWDAWSPWAKLDPNAKNTFEGPESGKGAIFKWSGNSEVGEGMMTVLESKPAELIHIKLDFVRPFEDTNDVTFQFEPVDDGTFVTWTMEGKHNFMSKAMCLVMDMNKMIGDDFEKGLASMKEVVEKEGKGS